MPTPLSDIPEAFQSLKTAFGSGVTQPYEFRMTQLRGLLRLLEENEDAILGALETDFSKPRFETCVTEVLTAKHDLHLAMSNLKGWMRPEAAETPLTMLPGKSFVQSQPQGVVLIISPFNYPLQLAVMPLTGAIAAGNCAVLKPSELTPATSTLLSSLIPRYLDSVCYRVVEGAIPETTELLKLPFDHFFFTGSEQVARIVMRAAAEHLSKCTLELGGKSPVVVDKNFGNMDLAAKRIVWGKFVNCGQTCVAPDYVLVEREAKERLVEAMKRTVREFFGEDPRASPHYARIVSKRHAERLQSLLRGSSPGFKVELGGQVNVEERYVSPTILSGVTPSDDVMQQEIFGPLLPVIAVASLDDALHFVNERPKPLALYVFSDDSRVRTRFMERTSSGGIVVNDTLLHVANPYLPFGGVGTSGMGSYHGKYSFDAFSHKRAVLLRSSVAMLDAPQRYPPYSASKLSFMRRVASLPITSASLARTGLGMLAVLVALAAVWAAKRFA